MTRTPKPNYSWFLRQQDTFKIPRKSNTTFWTILLLEIWESKNLRTMQMCVPRFPNVEFKQNETGKIWSFETLTFVYFTPTTPQHTDSHPCPSPPLGGHEVPCETLRRSGVERRKVSWPKVAGTRLSSLQTCESWIFRIHGKTFVLWVADLGRSLGPWGQAGPSWPWASSHEPWTISHHPDALG